MWSRVDARSGGYVARVSEQAEKRDETEAERLDRNLNELLQELRVAIPGIQFLFAFLLVVPFQQGWVNVTDFEKNVFYVALLATAVSGVCLMSAPARHRLRFREMDKEWVVASTHKYTIAGLAFLGIAITSVILLVSHVVFSPTTAIVAAALTALAIVWIWFGAPLVRELQED
jgi:archaellum biogenesis protein FlaJ (TadC family)